jgi:lysophospholipid acyltransferase (LPLAT)-like uncharacterized protein
MTREDRRRRFRIARRRLGAAVLPHIAPALVRRLSKSWKLDLIGAENLEAAQKAGGMVITLWHGRMMLPIASHAHRGYHVLVSPSDDGSLIIPILSSFGIGVVRGSTNKNPSRAARELLDRLNGGGRIALTPDGPRGPRHSMNLGAAWMAKVSGFPLVPLGVGCDRAWHLKSWDRFTIPKYGAKVALVYGDLIHVPADADDRRLQETTAELQRRMLAAEERGFEHVRAPRDW